MGLFPEPKGAQTFRAASQALFRVQENYQIEQVWVSFQTFWGLTFLMDENCKITEPSGKNMQKIHTMCEMTK